jgi:hypothetical protein
VGEGSEGHQASASSTGSSTEGKPRESAWTELLKDAAKALIPIFLTGASLLGFVAFAGAVIVWTRFDAIGVPPDQAVKAVPRNELVATGSSLLLLFGFFGVLALLGSYLVDRGGRATPGMSRALLLLVALEGLIAIVLTDDVTMLAKVGVGLGFFALIALAVILTFDTQFATYADALVARDGETKAARRGPDALHDIRGNPRLSVWVPVVILLDLVALGALVTVLVLVGPAEPWLVVSWFLLVGVGIALPLLLGVAWQGIEASRTRERDDAEVEAYGENHHQSGAEVIEDQEAARLAKRRPHRLVLRFWGVCAFLVLAVAAIAGPAIAMGQSWLAISFAAAFILTAGVWRVAVLSNARFMWYGLAVFISVPLFGTCTLMVRNVADPQVQPMALIRSTDGPREAIQGIYVTEGSDRVYFASVATEGCEEELTPVSGRLQWVPKSEVVAMSVGPLQDVDKAGKAALEMADALTPSIETSTGEQVSLSTEGELDAAEEAPSLEVEEPSAGLPKGEESGGGEGDQPDKESGGSGEDEEAKPDEQEEEAGASEAIGGEAGTQDHRLASAGPAIRPNFGAGLKLVPAAAQPGDVVELRMSAPNTANGVDGFGETPEGYDLRLNGVRLAVLRVPVEDPARAEYVKTAGGRVLPIVDYFKVDEGSSSTGYVRLARSAVHSVEDVEEDRGNFTLELDSSGKLAPLKENGRSGETEPPVVILPSGEEEVLRYGLLRRSWSPTKIKFRVPSNARTGVVSVECGQLAGQPLLDAVHPPVARIAVRVHPGTEKLTFDSRQSVDENEATPSRHWLIAGRRMGEKPVVSTELPPRLTPYEVSLTISDPNGLSDRVALQIWRLPSQRFTGARAGREKRRAHGTKVRHALEVAIGSQKPVGIELDGHADLEEGDVGDSLDTAERLRRLLFAPREADKGGADGTGGLSPAEEVPAPKASDARPLLNGGPAVPMLVRAFGESCPIVRHPGPQQVNGRVEVFLLGPGVTVGTGKRCRAARSSRVSW